MDDLWIVENLRDTHDMGPRVHFHMLGNMAMNQRNQGYLIEAMEAWPNQRTNRCHPGIFGTLVPSALQNNGDVPHMFQFAKCWFTAEYARFYARFGVPNLRATGKTVIHNPCRRRLRHRAPERPLPQPNSRRNELHGIYHGKNLQNL